MKTETDRVQRTGSVYPRGNRLYVAYYDRVGKRRSKATPYTIGQEREAKAFLELINRRVAADSPDTRGKSAADTVENYGLRYLEKRRRRIRSAGDEAIRLTKHVFPRIGRMRIVDVKPRHLEEMVWCLREEAALAPRTIRHIWAALSRMFKSAVKDELIPGSPCILDQGVLPKNIDKDPNWRATAIYERDEAALIVSDERIPWARRVLYALKFFAGLRHGEAAGLKFNHYAPDRRPLGCLTVANSYDEAGTKTSVTRYVPVHVELAAMLQEWLAIGWRESFGRSPTPDDLVVPTDRLTVRKNNVSRDLHLDLDALGLRKRRGHDMKRTHISLLNTDGARRDLTKLWTHGASTNILDVYTSIEWPVLCAEMLKLRLARRESAVVLPLVRAIGDEDVRPKSVEAANRCFTTASDTPRHAKTSMISVIPAGLEPATYGLGILGARQSRYIRAHAEL